MEETSTPATVSMPPAPRKSAGKSPRPAAVPRPWIPRPAFVAIAFVLMLTVGWGAFQFLGRQSPSDEEAELADLEGFEDESPTLGAPEAQTRSHSGGSFSRDSSPRSLGENATHWQASSTPGSSKLPALSVSPENPSARFEQTPFESAGNHPATSGAWLMGTIEADDAPQRIAMPPRVSSTAAEGPLFR